MIKLKILENKTSVLCGASGVGKSSILNALFPKLQLKTGEVSKTEIKIILIDESKILFLKQKRGVPLFL